MKRVIVPNTEENTIDIYRALPESFLYLAVKNDSNYAMFLCSEEAGYIFRPTDTMTSGMAGWHKNLKACIEAAFKLNFNVYQFESLDELSDYLINKVNF